MYFWCLVFRRITSNCFKVTNLVMPFITIFVRISLVSHLSEFEFPAKRNFAISQNCHQPSLWGWLGRLAGNFIEQLASRSAATSCNLGSYKPAKMLHKERVIWIMISVCLLDVRCFLTTSNCFKITSLGRPETSYVQWNYKVGVERPPHTPDGKGEGCVIWDY